jgi:hypothetical protein
VADNRGFEPEIRVDCLYIRLKNNEHFLSSPEIGLKDPKKRFTITISLLDLSELMCYMNPSSPEETAARQRLGVMFTGSH